MDTLQGFEDYVSASVRKFHKEIFDRSNLVKPGILSESRWVLALEVYSIYKDVVPESELDKYNPNMVINQRIQGLQTPRIVLYKKIRQYFNGENF